MPGPPLPWTVEVGFLGPVAGEGHDGPVRRRPFSVAHSGSFGMPSSLPRTCLRLLLAEGVGGYVLFVPGTLGHPHVGDGQVKRGICSGTNGDPLIGMNSQRRS